MSKRTSVWLSEQQNKKLEALAKRTGVKRAELIRRFIDEGLAGRRARIVVKGKGSVAVREFTLAQLKRWLRSKG